MHRRRWLIVGLCFCVFSGCVSCQSNYDYCGPMPDEGGDFMYRKNSILGGDPSMPLATGTPTAEAAEETGPEPTPAPPPDEEPTPGLDLDGLTDESGPEIMPDEDGEAQPQTYEEEASDELLSDDELTDEELSEEDDLDAEDEDFDERPVSALQWHAPTGEQRSSRIKQVQFR